MGIIKVRNDNQLNVLRSNCDFVIATGSGGSGKAQPYDSKVLTPDGWVNMGDLKVGSLIMNPSGRAQTVIAIYEQGERECVEFTFSDGAKCECDLEHLWLVNIADTKYKVETRTYLDESKSFYGRIITSSEIIKRLDKNTEKLKLKDVQRKRISNISIPMTNPISLRASNKNNKIHPYLLGFLIGDGCLTRDDVLLLSTNDIDIICKLNKLGYNIVKRNVLSDKGDYIIRDNDNYIRNSLDNLGLIGKYSYEKKLPKQCFYFSLEDKKMLIQGLIDSDGTTTKEGTKGKKSGLYYCTTSKQLAVDIQELIRSLGGKCTISEKKPHFTYKGEYKDGRLAYILYIQTSFNDELVWLERKKERLIPYRGKNASVNGLMNTIKSYRYVGKKKCRCIAVDNPNRLYITNDYIVTHNTYAISMLNSYDISNNSSFSATYLRKNIGDFFTDGGIASMMKEIYPLRSDKDKSNKKYAIGDILSSPQNMGVYFDNGATMRFKHIADERKEALEPSFKGIQSNRFIFDEADQFQATTVFYVPTRLRGKGGGKRQIIIVQNPERECFVRQFCGCGKFGGGWIADDGEVIPEMNGVVRYFHIIEGDINKVYWGKTKKEVYEQCKHIIDPLLEKSKKLKLTYESYIQSCVFFNLSTLDNEDMLKDNPEYLGSLAMSSGAKSMFSANWNYSKYDDKSNKDGSSMLDYHKLSAMFQNKPNINDKLRIVADPAREGVDNFTMAAFQGFHCIDIWYEQVTDPKTIPNKITAFMNKHGATNKELIVDSRDGFEYVKHLFSGCFLYNGGASVSNKGKNFRRARDENAFMMCQMIERGLITFEPSLADMVYKHQKSVKKDKTVLLQMTEEAKCYVFEDDPYGKKHLMNKKDQAYILGGKSSDLTDLILMLCGGLIYDCYKELANKNTNTNFKESINAISNNPENINLPQYEKKKTTNIANLLTKKFGW